MAESKGGGADASLQLIFLLIFVMAFVWAIWFFAKDYILEIMRWFRLIEIWGIAQFDSQAKACMNWLYNAPVVTDDKAIVSPSNVLYGWAVQCFGAEKLRSVPEAELRNYFIISPASLGVIADKIGYYIRWPAIVICLLIAWYALYRSPRNKFQVRHDLESFIKFQSKMWPILSPIVNFKPSSASARAPGQIVPDKLPPFAEPLSPEEWLSYNRITLVNGIPEREAMRRAFLQQLGSPWRGIDDLPMHVIALFAAFALKGVQKREESEDLLGRIALCWSLEKGFQPSAELVKEIKKLATDPKIGGEALAIANAHAWRATAMLAVLKWARQMGGVLAPAQFLWLRAEDRNLWYPLNNLGRRTFHAEAAGAFAHYMAEVDAKKPLPIPRLDTAIITMNQYISNNPNPLPPREEPKK